jgi:hypothetical protein
MLPAEAFYYYFDIVLSFGLPPCSTSRLQLLVNARVTEDHQRH